MQTPELKRLVWKESEAYPLEREEPPVALVTVTIIPPRGIAKLPSQISFATSSFGEPLCWFPDHAHSAVAPVFHQCTGGKLLVNSGWTKNFSTASHAPSITSRIALCWRSGPQFRPTSLLRCIDSQWTLFDIQCSEEAHAVVRVLTGQPFRSEAIQKAQSPGDYGLCPFLRNSDSEERKSRFSANEVTSNTKLPDVRKRQPKSSKA